MKTAEDILWKLGVIPDDEGINILTTWKEDICKKQREKVSELDFNSFVNDEAVVWEEFNKEKREWEYKISKEFILNAPEPDSCNHGLLDKNHYCKKCGEKIQGVERTF